MAKYILTSGKHSGFTDEGVRKLYQTGDIIDLDEAAAKNLVGKIMSVEEYQARQKIEKARIDAEARVQAEIEEERTAEQAKAKAAVDAAARKVAAATNKAGSGTSSTPKTT